MNMNYLREVEYGLEADKVLDGVPRVDLQLTGAPTVRNIRQTLDMLLENEDMSLARFGDGEMTLMNGGGCYYQWNSFGVCRRLSEALFRKRPKCLVGLNRAHYYYTSVTLPRLEKWYSEVGFGGSVRGHIHLLLKREDAPNSVYMAAEVTCARHTYRMGRPFFTEFFARWERVFEGKDVILVTGRGDLPKGVFYKARSLRILHVHPRDAMDAYCVPRQQLLDANGDGSAVVALCCGPLASCLAWDLSDKMRCLDIGHLPDDYESFKFNTNAEEEFGAFYCK